MQPHISARASAGTVELTEARVLQVTDLTTDPAQRPLWRSHGRGAPDAPTACLPAGAIVSPMGFALSAPSLPAALSPAGLRITFVAPGDDPGPSALVALAHANGAGRPVQSVRVKPPSSGDGDVLLSIGPAGARITTTPAAWKAVAEPVLLAACQYWRFAAIDAEIDRLTECAHRDLDHSNMPGAATLRDRARLTEAARAARALMLDLPHFEGPLTDPLPYLSTERAATVFEVLAEKLHLEAWCERLDERAEAVEDAYEALAEKLFEYKNFAWEAALEALIIVILIAELGVSLYETFAP